LFTDNIVIDSKHIEKLTYLEPKRFFLVASLQEVLVQIFQKRPDIIKEIQNYSKIQHSAGPNIVIIIITIIIITITIIPLIT